MHARAVRVVGGCARGRFPDRMLERVHTLSVTEDLDSISATEVRERIRQGAAWEHLVPEAVVPLAREIYSV